MIPYDIDPSLHSSQPQDQLLDDGFTRRSQGEAPPPPSADTAASLEEALASKSDF